MDLTKNRGRPMRPANILERAAKEMPLRAVDAATLMDIAAILRHHRLHTADDVAGAMPMDTASE